MAMLGRGEPTKMENGKEKYEVNGWGGEVKINPFDSPV